jgi:predicted SpoU family rRNA methylase
MIYVIAPAEATVVKIGYTINKPSFRLGNLQVGNPEQLVVRWAGEGDERLERHLHAVFKDYRLRGEWFDLSTFGDPVQAVKDEIRKASERLGRGEGLLAAGRHHSNAPRLDLKAFDKVPSTTAPAVEDHQLCAVAAPWLGARGWEDRFPSAERATTPEGRNCRQTSTEPEPQPGCIRAWQGKCHRPAGTTCGC